MSSPKKMSSLDPIIAVKDVNQSAEWYQSLLGCRRTHGGDDFAVLENEKGEIILCLHQWGEHGHPSMINPDTSTGNGLILYFRTENLKEIRQNAEKVSCAFVEELHRNPNSGKKEFSLRDPDGYYLTITEFHKYKG